VEGEGGGDTLRAEGAGVFSFIQELDPAHPDVIVIEVELLGIVDRVTELDSLADVGLGDFVEGAFEADGGIVIDHALVADEEDLVEFGLGESTDLHPGDGGIVAVDGFIVDATMKLMVVVVLEPEPEGLVDLLKAEGLLEA
jgi:hypothetical protein